MALGIASALRPCEGETSCGDRCDWWCTETRLVLAMVDGLGHGRLAELAAEAAIQSIAQQLGSTCAELFAACNVALSHTRGVAMSVAIVELCDGRVEVASVGNVRTRLLGKDRDLRLGGARGIVGAGYRNLAPEHLQLDHGDTLIFFTDGIEEFADVRPLLQREPLSGPHLAEEIIAAFGSARDDVGVLIYRHTQPEVVPHDE